MLYEIYFELISRFLIVLTCCDHRRCPKSRLHPPPGCTLNINDPQVQEAAIRIQSEATGTKIPNACWHHWHFSAFWTELCYHERLQCASNCSLNPWRANPFPPHLSGAGSEGTKTIFTLFKNQQSKAYPLKRVIRQVGEHQKIFSLSIPISVVCVTKSKRMNSFEKRH